ncbi:hypothetical protein SAMN02910400_00248 [Lachnospiraceae bacterium C10]|nr:hypothetical protein SAMN02910400_00248 [Lachnospiraceae bacterium C10]
MRNKDGSLVKSKNGVYYVREKAYREPYTKKNIELVRKGKQPKGVYYTQTLAMNRNSRGQWQDLYEVGNKTPFKKPANGSFYAIKGTDDLFIFNWKSGGNCYDGQGFDRYKQLEWGLDASVNPGYQRNSILPYLKVTCSKPDMLKITNRKRMGKSLGKSFKWVKTGTCEITLELDSYKISYPVKVLSNTTKNNALAIVHNTIKKGMSEGQKCDAVSCYIDDIVNKPKKMLRCYDPWKYAKWTTENKAFVNRCYGYSYWDVLCYGYTDTNESLVDSFDFQLFPDPTTNVVLESGYGYNFKNLVR